MVALHLDPDRLFPADPRTRDIARSPYAGVARLPIVSQHGHADPRWFAYDQPWTNASELLPQPDHYLFPMPCLRSVRLEDLGIPAHGRPGDTDSRAAWRLFAGHQRLFRGTPSRLWLDHVFAEVFGFDVALSADTADLYYDRIGELLVTSAFRPRALHEWFGIEVIATTEGAHDTPEHHEAIRDFGWRGRVVTATTANLSPAEVEALLGRVMHGSPTSPEPELFRAQMLTEMARMGLEDGLVMQIHTGAVRNHNCWLHGVYGRDKGADIPSRTDYVHAVKPLLDAFGTERDLSIILFTLDETSYARELAPLAGHYPCLKLGPAWWFHDSPEGMRRFRKMPTETADLYNTVGFNDDTPAVLSIPARHDVSRRVDCGFLARLVAEGRMGEEEAGETAVDLACNLVSEAYRLDEAVPAPAPLAQVAA